MPIVVGYVPTKDGQAALDTAIAESRLRGSSLVVVNTSTGAGRTDSRFLTDDALAELTAQLDASQVPYRIEHSVGTKDASETLVDVANETHAELIVIGLRRRTPVGKLIMGSQAQTVLLDAECPVLAVKAPS